uniref:beta-N-acetylhexosaminidase n=1 Tax=Salmo trutta TaxID=8032 RepID=A0A673WKL9_SALTR
MVTKRQALRAVALCLVLVAAVKLLLSEYRTERKQKLAIVDPGSFWHQGPKVKEAVTVHKSEVLNSFFNWAQKPEVPEPPVEKGADTAPLETSKGPARIVHLDLKGAAPKVKYMKQIFPLFSSLGADGVLLEYEDMFPYHGNLTILRSPYAYSMEDIEEIKSLAKLNKLELIPLVQVFGHLEFVLKHERYFHLREVRAFPNSLNPHHPGSVALVKDMVSQVMDCHPDARWFHMGADEVRGLGESQDSKNWLHSNKGDVGKMFLNHAVSLARFITERRSGVRVILWDDMLRKISPATIKESGLQDLASPTIWNYLKKMDTDGIGTLISRYHEAGFKGVWFASAFKGGTGIDQRWTPLDYQLQNHLSWIKVMNSMTKYPSVTLHGILLTGWQRFEHHTVLCELLPVGIPSLAMCLQSLKHGKCLGNCKIGTFSQSKENTIYFSDGNLLSIHLMFISYSHIKGGFSRYHRKYNFANPRIIGFFQGRLKKLLDKWETYIENFRMEMEGIYFPDTVEEWMEENVNANMDLLRENARDAERILKLNGQPKSLKTF